MKLEELAIGKSAVILSVGGEGALRQHFLDMGLIQGTEVTMVKYAPMGDPVEVRIHSYELTLRLADAGRIAIDEMRDAVKEKEQPDAKAIPHPGFGEGGKYHNKAEEHPLPEGELLSFALAGNQNCGKTTLFNCISGIDRPDSGRVVLGGQDITGQPGHISYMLQKDLLLPYKKIIDNVSLPLLLAGKSKKEARTEAGSHFAQFGLEGTQQQYPAELSGGMRQRAALLRTYLAGDRVALLDEPFSALDTITKSAMHRWYLSVMEEIKLSTIFITHDIDEAVLLSDRILILSGRPGKITHQITIAEPKPRRRDFNLTPEFLDYKKQVIDALGVVL